MSTKFKQGDKVLHRGNEVTIVVAQKDFSSKKIYYLLDSGLKVGENELSFIDEDSKIPANKSNEKEANLEKARSRYAELLGKDVPSNKKKDLDWLNEKILEKENEIKDNEEKAAKIKKDKEAYEALAVLSLDDLHQLVKDKELPIDVEDYESENDLVVAICQEMGITIPEVEE